MLALVLAAGLIDEPGGKRELVLGVDDELLKRKVGVVRQGCEGAENGRAAEEQWDRTACAP